MYSAENWEFHYRSGGRLPLDNLYCLPHSWVKLPSQAGAEAELRRPLAPMVRGTLLTRAETSLEGNPERAELHALAAFSLSYLERPGVFLLHFPFLTDAWLFWGAVQRTIIRQERSTRLGTTITRFP